MASSMEFQLYTYITLHMQVFLIVGHNQTLKSHSLGHAIFVFGVVVPISMEPFSNVNHYPLKEKETNVY